MSLSIHVASVKLSSVYVLCMYVLVSLWIIAFRKKPIICVVSWVGKVIVQVSSIAYNLQTVAERNSILLLSFLNSGWLVFWHFIHRRKNFILHVTTRTLGTSTVYYLTKGSLVRIETNRVVCKFGNSIIWGMYTLLHILGRCCCGMETRVIIKILTHPCYGAIFILRKGVLRLFWTTHPPT